MRLATLFAILAFALGDITLVDHLRDKLYTLEKDLWVNVTDPEWRNAGLGGDIELTKAFAAFNDRLEAVRMPPRPPLESWLWVKASEKLTVVDGLYKNFMEFVKRQSAPGAVPAPVREWLDLAEVVLMDPKLSVPQAVEKLDAFLEHGDLFRSSLQVIYVTVTQSKININMNITPKLWWYSH